MSIQKTKNKVTFGRPYLEKTENKKIRLCCDIIGIKNDPIKIWYETEEKYEEYLTYEKTDAFLVAMLPYLMVHTSHENHTVVELKQPISEKLYYQLTTIFIPALSNFTDVYNPIDLVCETDSKELVTEKKIATGVSGGVDSFYTLLSNLNNEKQVYRITHGLYFNVGYLGGYEGDKELAQLNLSKEICKEMNIESIHIKSNICREIYKIPHAMIVVYMFASFPLALQKLLSVYFLSSQVSFADFAFDVEAAEHFDLINAFSFSTENLSFYPAGGEVTRIQKTDFIADYDIARKNLFVCRDISGKSMDNCSRCSKCTRTMVQLDALGKLDLFREVFDADAYKKNPNYYWGYFFFKGKDNVYTRETLDVIKKNGRKVPKGARIAGMIKIIKNGFKRENPLAKSYRP